MPFEDWFEATLHRRLEEADDWRSHRRACLLIKMTRARIAARSAEQIEPALLAGKVQRKVSNGIAGLAAAGTRIVSAAGIRAVRPFKEIFCYDVSEFKSYIPSHAVWSLWAMSGLRNY